MNPIVNISPRRRAQLLSRSETFVMSHPCRPLAITLCAEGILSTRFINDAGACRKLDRDISGMPLLITATPFAEQVYRALLSTETATTISYGRLAALAGHLGAARAVGTAMARNRHPWLIPCHRVIAADGSLGNYTPDPALKPLLLAVEGRLKP